MDVIIDVVTISIVAIHLITLIFMQTQRQYRLWLKLSAGLLMLVGVSYLLPDDGINNFNLNRNAISVLLLTMFMMVFGGVVLYDPIASTKRGYVVSVWFGMCTFWGVAFTISVVVGDSTTLEQSDFLTSFFDLQTLSALIAILGNLCVGVLLLAVSLYDFYHARFPELANRALFWVINSALVVLGVLLASSANRGVAVLGMLGLLIGQFAAIYARRTHRVLEVRGVVIVVLRALILISIMASILFVAFYVIQRNELDVEPTENLLIIAGLAIVIAAFLVPLRRATVFLFNQIMMSTRIDASRATREYSQLISEVVELDKLVQAVTKIIVRIMKVRNSCLILLNRTNEESIEILVMYPGSSYDKTTATIATTSPLYHALAVEQKPISQFDVEFSPKFKTVPEGERQFFSNLKMSAYAPIVLDNMMIGLLVAGSKKNDTAFYLPDLSLLATMARQTGVALRNARLVEDLQHLNVNMQSLNKALKSTNEQMVRMDAVKTDFVTIASHELRTPLAQVRGYTDIFDALNEQGMLDEKQIKGLVANLRKATERMEELISAMIDVSQLDVNAMDLHYTPCSIESILRMAIEPLTDVIKQRKLTLTAKGLRGLPNVQADLQRIVQAFRNVVVNAIKFTPDGGLIEVTGELQENDENILVKVKDGGVGIDKSNLEMVFKKFFRAYDPSLHSTGAYKFMGAGPGLGLTIARGVIEGHGGKIWTESPGHDMKNFPGSTFFILLPISAPTDSRSLTFEGGATGALAVEDSESYTT